MPRKKVGIAAPEIAITVTMRSMIELCSHRGDDPGRHADQHLDDQRIDRQQDGRLDAIEQRLGDRLADEDRLAEIEPQHVRRTSARTAPAADRSARVARAACAMCLRRGPIAQDDRRRIAGSQVDQREDDDRRPPGSPGSASPVGAGYMPSSGPQYQRSMYRSEGTPRQSRQCRPVRDFAVLTPTP